MGENVERTKSDVVKLRAYVSHMSMISSLLQPCQG